MDNKLSIRKLQKNEKVNSFNCGDTDLNEFILNESVLYRKALLAVSYVDAYADAIPFYMKNGFIPLNNEDVDAETRLLYFDLATITDDELDG